MAVESSVDSSSGQLLQVKDVMSETDYSRRHINRLCESGCIPYGVWIRFSPGGKRFFLRTAWDMWLAAGGNGTAAELALAS
jgi:hypothetical protein